MIEFLEARSPNVSLSIAGIMQSWRTPAPFPGEDMLPEMRLGTFGNMNVGGTPEGATAPTIPPWHPLFYSLIEPGIRDTCRHFVETCGWITYTSCEGHYYGNDGAAPVERHVGILPRDEAEHAEILNYLTSVWDGLSERWTYRSVVMALILHDLHDSCSATRVIDLVYHKVPGASWPNYFRDLGGATDAVLDYLAREEYVSREMYKSRGAHGAAGR